jgi:hypothetical protein
MAMAAAQRAMALVATGGINDDNGDGVMGYNDNNDDDNDGNDDDKQRRQRRRRRWQRRRLDGG